MEGVVRDRFAEYSKGPTAVWCFAGIMLFIAIISEVILFYLTDGESMVNASIKHPEMSTEITLIGVVGLMAFLTAMLVGFVASLVSAERESYWIAGKKCEEFLKENKDSITEEALWHKILEEEKTARDIQPRPPI